MFWPRRSAPAAGNRMAPNSAPCGMPGRLTPSSADLDPVGAVVRNQTSQNAVPLPEEIFAPSFCRALAIDGANSEGGGPAGSILYCAAQTLVRRTKVQSSFRISIY